MLRHLFVFCFISLFSITAHAGKCTCTDDFGNGKKGCFENASQCYSYCSSMTHISFTPGTCTAPPIPPMPPGQVKVWALTETLWNDSGLDIQVGEAYSLTAIVGDEWQTNQYWIAGGADGHPTYRGGPSYLMPGAPEGALVGRVAGGAVFLVGSNGKTPAGASGRLYLGGNDEVQGRYDNRGFLIVTYTKDAPVEK